MNEASKVTILDVGPAHLGVIDLLIREGEERAITSHGQEHFLKVITDALEKRRSIPHSQSRHPDFNSPVYVVSMCESLLALIHGSGNRAVTLQEVLLLETTCTGADYAEKLALRSHRLSEAAAAPTTALL